MQSLVVLFKLALPRNSLVLYGFILPVDSRLLLAKLPIHPVSP